MSVDKGRMFEAEAARYIERIGYNILERNFRSRRGEIDIIAADGETLVFVEVKGRAADSLASPGEYVDARKQSRLAHAALTYINGRNLPARFDVIEIAGENLNHIKNAFFMPENIDTFGW
ncbi:MAG: YraN family protein [Christensenellales bacterium]|jgi:putative endonuclease